MAGDKSDLKIQVDRGQRGKAPAPSMPNFAQAAEANSEVAQQIRAKRKTAHAQHAASKAAAAAEPAEAPEPTPEREDLDSVELQLPNGLKVLLGPPPSVSLTMRVLHYYREVAAWSLPDEQTTRALMCVRSIDGVAVSPVTNPVDRAALGNRLGDEGIAICVYAHRTYWPFVRMTELPLIKKNQRVA